MITITEYIWGGKKFGFKIKSHCKECSITKALVEDVLKKEFKGKNVKFETKMWLTNIFEALSKGLYHPPCIAINGKRFFNHSKRKPIPDRKELVMKVLSLIIS
jgi:hypothetical protein